MDHPEEHAGYPNDVNGCVCSDCQRKFIEMNILNIKQDSEQDGCRDNRKTLLIEFGLSSQPCMDYHLVEDNDFELHRISRHRIATFL